MANFGNNKDNANEKLENIGRIGDIYIHQEAFQHLEKWIFQTLETIPEEKREHTSIAELLFEVGKQIKDDDSILAAVAKKKVPIICPAFIDSIAGFHLWLFGQDKKIIVDPILDVNRLMGVVYEAKRGV